MNLMITRVQQVSGALLLPSTVHWWLFLAYVAVLPIMGTTALRNLLLGVLTLQSLAYYLAPHRTAQPVMGAKGVPAWLILWALFLVVFPTIARDHAVAWRELRGQWIESLLTWLIVFVVVARRSSSELDFRGIALACGVYPLLYFALFLWTWMSGFGDRIYLVWNNDFARVAENFGNIFWTVLATFPWGFRGFDPLHANLGAAAAHALIAGLAFAVAFWRLGSLAWRWWLVLLLGLLSLIPFLAHSRASVLSVASVFLIVAIGIGVNAMRKYPGQGVNASIGRWRGFLFAVMAMLCFIAILGYKAYEVDPRWKKLFYKATIGFTIPDPVGLVCSSSSAEVASRIRMHLDGMPSEQVDQIVSSLDGDVGRAIVMRVGLLLVLENPLGFDGSRQAYKRLIGERCGGVPAIDFAHPHQSWIDMALALGWVGVALYLGMLIGLGIYAVRSLSRPEERNWALGLVMLCLFWVIRGFLDSVYREHYLQMQAVLIGFFWFGMRQAARRGLPCTENGAGGRSVHKGV